MHHTHNVKALNWLLAASNMLLVFGGLYPFLAVDFFAHKSAFRFRRHRQSSNDCSNTEKICVFIYSFCLLHFWRDLKSTISRHCKWKLREKKIGITIAKKTYRKLWDYVLNRDQHAKQQRVLIGSNGHKSRDRRFVLQECDLRFRFYLKTIVLAPSIAVTLCHTLARSFVRNLWFMAQRTIQTNCLLCYVFYFSSFQFSSFCILFM